MNCATTSQEDKGFNSKLVRLEVKSSVSIPNWFDTKPNREDKGFNSKLVRLEDA